ncbi:hypothetical protein [[Kitasatospora] papulosa]|uniref:hypothetical protein n=1 Tax=[Kitasatospora] papulosa TaxID=1464011 RepID=UPI00369ED179
MGDGVGKELEKIGDGEPVQPRAELVIVLAQQGVGRNEISRRTGIPAVTVSRIAAAEGLKFDRAKMERPLKARIADLKLAQAGIAEGLQEDVTFARVLLRTARTHRDYAFAAKAISDLTQSVQRMTPEVTSAETLEDAKDFLTDLKQGLGEFRDHMVKTGQWDEQGNEIKQEEQNDES